MVSSTDLRALRQQMMRVAAQSGEGHLPSSYSVLDIIYVLHKDIMRPIDKFLLSKGHSALALYAVLAATGRMSTDALDYFCDENASYLKGHPERAIDFGIEATTGSLGHGMAMACGLAYAERLGCTGARIFCLVGDGECEEGSIWEAAHLAARHKLSNLTVLVDANGTSPNNIDDTRGSQSSLCDKFRAFGWFVSRINGHDHRAIARACQATGGERPFVVVCDTVKGYGCEAMEREPQVWHHRTPSAAELHGMLESVR